ncbi:hypothetical protein CONPUDRAFT_99430 [Coniophora puteana RWD-64-598 SS2]|uniref:Uncharacterized protein n=1 Tax=Coniophora puteana (strain RWD-64-598) TaxID=741705 RepID=A0A5M3MXD2_CONPW|nr:uncharacterized protein CONPUDRAFT_99430 [Coniophora puteana RWD-64-598 SS2]EIW83823.1 hypothetical protein CONPUDRAFT_99430 [Coniophora puteana RWD-64-598 SS2]
MSYQAPPAYTAKQQPPPSGYRIPLEGNSQFPGPQHAGAAPCYDLDRSPVYIGSAILEDSVHPCKIAPHLDPPCRVGYGGQELSHRGRYDLLPYDPATMEWVPASLGRIPDGRRPVEGGYENNGARLYHACAVFQGVRVPGKTGQHLSGANFAFGGEQVIERGYEILCWRH